MTGTNVENQLSLANTVGALQESEKRYRRLFESAKDGILILNADTGRVDDVNPFLLKLLGYGYSAICGQHIWELGVFKDIAASKDAFKTLQDKEYIRYENLPLETCDGRRVQVEFVSNVYEVDHTKVIQCNIRDITARKREEARVRELATIVESSDDAIISKTLEGHILSWNKAAERIYGYTAEEIVGQSVSILIPRDLPDELPEILAKLKSGETVTHYETIRVRKDGKCIHVSLTISPVKDAEARIVGVSTIARDITERKQAEKVLRESEEKYRQIVETANEGICMTDADNLVTDVNQKMADMLGYLPEEIIGKPLVHFLFPEDLADHQEKWSHRLQGLSATYERRFRRSDGGECWTIVSVTAIRTEDGRFMGGFGMLTDITERKRAEEEIKQTNAYLENIFENSPDVITIVDKHGRIIKWNKMAAEIYGYTFEEMKGKPAFDLYADKDELEKMLMGLRREGSVKKWEIQMRRKDGTVIPFEISICLLHDSENRTLGSVGVARDLSGIKETLASLRASNDQLNQEIIERKLTEKALKESEERYRVLFEGSTHGILTVDIETKRFVFANPSICHMPGYSENELLELSIEDIHPKDSPDMVLSELESQLLGEKKLFSALPCLRKDGTVFFADIAGTITSIQGRKVAVGFFADVTERVKQTRQIEDLNRLYSVLSRVSQAVVRAKSPEAFLEQACREIVEGGGFLLSWIGQVELITNAVVPKAFWGGISEYVRGITVYADNRPEGRGPTGTCIRERHPFVHNDFLHDPMTIPWRDGAAPFGIASAAAFPIERAAGVWGALTIYSNELDRFGTEDVKLLKKVAGNIGFALDNLDSELRRKHVEAQLLHAQTMEAIGTLAGGIAHDFNNILGIILGYADLELLEFVGSDESRDRVEHIRKAALRARDLVRQILAFSRTHELERGPLQLGPILKEVLKLLRSALPSTIEIRRKIDLADDYGDLITADATQIHQVLMNLCTNAGHAMREKGGILDVSMSNVHFGPHDSARPPELPPGLYVRICVSDTGCGMDDKVMERIFEPYFTTKGVGEGTGMGLSVVHGIVRGHEGAITVVSELGAGSTFCVFFPAGAKEVEIQPDVGPVGIPMGKESILFVDDEEELARLGKEALERFGYTVFSTAKAVEAFDVFRTAPERFDLVVTDQTMPQMTGMELAAELRQIRPSIPVILCTGFSELVTEQNMRATGIQEVMMKPLIMDEVGRVIRRVLDREGRK